MDSKLKRSVITAAALSAVAVTGAVGAVNYRQIIRLFEPAPQETSAKPAAVVSGNELTDFMKDETFFDAENASPLQDIDSSGKIVDMVVTSVEKDLRIKIVDLMGQPVPGEEFFVEVEGNGEYKDLDKDGIIYIGGLSAGDYYVSLRDIEGYHIPPTRVRVAVKDKVEYTVIEDIAYLIKTEDEIDAGAEDTGIRDAVEEADDTEITTPVIAEESEFGIDVSKWNKEIDWPSVKKAGVQYAIIRCGYRGSTTGSLIEDPYFVKNIEGARAAGIKVGVYFFTQAVSEVEAVEEASMVITLCEKYKLDYPVFVDTEGAGGNGRADALNQDIRTAVVQAFCETIKSAGYTPGVYASKNWYNRNLNADSLKQYAIWLAEYKSEPTYTGDFHMWQYTSSGSIDGIEGRVDLNISLLK